MQAVPGPTSSPQSATGNKTSPNALEILLVILGALAGLVITIVIWQSVSSYQPMWPLPGLYFLEIVVLMIMTGPAFVVGAASGTKITWVAAGMLAAFSILGRLSVGFFYLPVAILIAVAALIYDVRNKQPVLAHLAIFLIAAVAQAALMLAIIRLL